ncbi:unnamed protein product [Linum tenue]|uniref:Uncharacterized protein n=1 Tax=Linum tenue TaxID=586396 RepID=A0AAV0PRD0_9ROSI|nr:unnamed protein product [Linum tenue]CAI0473515.1 unnamed protein product [Linum tenue]
MVLEFLLVMVRDNRVKPSWHLQNTRASIWPQ